MKVGILVLENCTPVTPIGCMEILNKAGRFYNVINGNDNETPFFEVHLVSQNARMVNTANNYPVYCHNTIKEVNKFDLVIVPGFDENIKDQLALNYAFVDWIKEKFNKGTEIASICTGTFILAEANLLNGRTATTHWAAADYFKKKYPMVKLLSNHIIVDEGKIYTSGGATSYHNLMIYLVEKFCGKEVANYTAKMLVLDINKASQFSYSIFSTQKNHGDKEILKAQNYMEINYNKRLSLDEISDKISISKRTFIRRFKTATGNTPVQYIQRLKVEAVKKELESNNDTIETLINKVGYDDITTFRKLFKRLTGVSPYEYRKKYTRLIYPLT